MSLNVLRASCSHVRRGSEEGIRSPITAVRDGYEVLGIKSRSSSKATNALNHKSHLSSLKHTIFFSKSWASIKAAFVCEEADFGD